MQVRRKISNTGKEKFTGRVGKLMWPGNSDETCKNGRKDSRQGQIIKGGKGRELEAGKWGDFGEVISIKGRLVWEFA